MKISVHLVDSVYVTKTCLVILQKKMHDEEKGHVFESAMQILLSQRMKDVVMYKRFADVPKPTCEVWCTTKFCCDFLKKSVLVQNIYGKARREEITRKTKTWVDG
jgi:hypothetical protein